MNSSPVRTSQDAMTVRHLRRGIGTVGIALPIVLPVGHALRTGDLALLTSISAYYHTEMRDVFVGGMCAIGVFLLYYRYRRLDDLLGTVTGVLAIAVAWLPVARTAPPGALTRGETVTGWIHQVCAAALFLLLAAFCFFLFTRADPTDRATRRKRVRNRIYYICGTVILAAVALAVASSALPASVRSSVKPLFWCETVAVFAFGLAWLVKGETIFRDEQGADAPSSDALERV